MSWVKKTPVVRSAFDKFSMEPLEEPVTVRLRFCKTEDLQYISHLDLQRVMSRVLVRSGVPVWFTQGFNPHAKMVFAMPLPVGTQSLCEYLDIRVDRKITLSEIAERINNEVTDNLKISEAYYPRTKFSEIAFVKYTVQITDGVADEKTAVDAVKLLTLSPLNIMKRSKSGEREVDITSYIKNVAASFHQGVLRLELTLTGGEGSLNPEAVVTVLRERLGLLADYPEKGSYTITRTDLFFADGREFE